MSTEIKLSFDLHKHQLENYPKEHSLMAKVDGKWQELEKLPINDDESNPEKR